MLLYYSIILITQSYLWIGRSGSVVAFPRSPDLMLCDFKMWRMIKKEVYKTNPRTFQQMKERITAEFDILNKC